MEPNYEDLNCEIEKILARRKDLEEKEKVITFYKTLLTSIEDELDEKIRPGENEVINGLLELQKQDLYDNDALDFFENLNKRSFRIDLLIVLHDKIQNRMNQVLNREEILQDIEKDMVTKPLFEASAASGDKSLSAAEMWEQVVNLSPEKKNIRKLKEMYPVCVIEKFFDLLFNYKEEIAMRLKRSHELTAAQTTHRMKKEDKKWRKIIEKAQEETDRVESIFESVREAYSKKTEVEKKNAGRINVPKYEHFNFFTVYDQMKVAIHETEKSIEDEKARRKELLAQIEETTKQQKTSLKMGQEKIQKIEHKSFEIVKNIKWLNGAVEIQIKRIDQMLQNVTDKIKYEDTYDMFF